MDNQKNLIIAIVLSVAIIFAFQALQPDKPKPTPGPTTTAPATPGTTPTTPGTAPPATPGTTPGTTPNTAAAKAATRDEALKRSKRVAIKTPRVTGSIALTGGRLDDLTLGDKYRETVKKDSARVHLLQPAGTPDGYFVDFGWVPVSGIAADKLPNDKTVWTASGDELTPDKPIELRWTNADGVTFIRRYAIDANYMLTVARSVENKSGQPLSLRPYALIRQEKKPKTLGFFILHEGPVMTHRDQADNDGVVFDPDYDDLKDNKTVQTKDSVGGWTGFTSQYWLVALIPNQKDREQLAFRRNTNGSFDAFTIGQAVTVAPGATSVSSSRVFAGAKESRTLIGYEKALNIPKFEWAIDYGWFWFFTQPFQRALLWIFDQVGNFGVAILILTIIIKLLFFPLANKSYKSMGAMKKLQPEMMKLRERYKDDKQKMNQELMGLYRKEKVNPAAGCLPIVLQIPVFFALYKVLFVSIEMRHAPFFGWIQDLSAKDPTSVLNLFGLLPWDAPDAGLLAFVSIGVWPIIMGITMWLQQKMNPAPADPTQAKIFMFLPIIFTFMLATFPAGLVIYWAWNNLLSVGQQWVIMRRQGVYAPAGGAKGKGKPKAESGSKGSPAKDDEPEPAPAAEAPASTPRTTRSNPAAAKKGGSPRGRSRKK